MDSQSEGFEQTELPYKVRIERTEGDKIVAETVTRTAVFLPEDLALKGKSVSEVLHRSIFDVNVYTASLAVDGDALVLAPPFVIDEGQIEEIASTLETVLSELE